jgi:acetyltransferase-like isoleucine patch superfamily enzyme
VELRSNKVNIHPTAKIADDVIIECDVFELGEHSYIGPGCRITCREFIAGDYLWMPGNVDIGRGGCNGVDSVVNIGHSVGIFEGTVINPSERVTIGNNVGIGAECLLWTHGAWLNPLEGFPFEFAEISIGNNVWLPARSIMLPGTNVGDDCVIGTGSIITKDIPRGSLAMGSPCKVIKENEYPKPVTNEERDAILSKILQKWFTELLPHKGYTMSEKSWLVHHGEITILEDDQALVFDTYGMIQRGESTALTEDLRDYLRRHGIRIYNGLPFKSMEAKYETYLKSTS